MPENERTLVIRTAQQLGGLESRRSFLRAMGVGGTVVLLPGVFAACRESTAPNADADVAAQVTAQTPVTLDLSNDVGILNFALLAELVDSTFYERVVALPNFSTLFTALEREMFNDFRADEVIHRQFLRQVLGTAAVVNNATVQFPESAFATKASILATALALETTGTAAYNGAGNNLQSADNLALAGKIVSMEARHAAAIADTIDLNSATPTGRLFADLTATVGTEPLTAFGANPTNALDVALEANAVAPRVQPFVVQQLAISRLPTEPTA